MEKRKLATIRRVDDLTPIAGADKIELAHIGGWKCVTEKGKLQKGGFCCYFEVDSLLPSDNPAFDFLAKGNKEKVINIDGKEYHGWRLKTIKLRGQISQGLALPVNSFLGILTQVVEPNFAAIDEFEGEDISEILNVVKYEPPIPAQLAGKVRGSFPGFLKRTDEERVQNIVKLLPSFVDTEFYVTEKLDGTSATFYNKDGRFGVCSRNLDLIETEGNTHWEIAKRYHLDEILPDNYCIQGEIVGEGIQQNPLKIKGHELYVFNVYRIDTGEYLNLDKMEEVCETLGLKMVPILWRCVKIDPNIDDLLLLANNKSVLCPTAAREGVVYRPIQESTMRIGNTDMRLSFKVISNEYLLKHDQ